MNSVVFIKINNKTGKKVIGSSVKNMSKYIALNIDEALEALKYRKAEFSFYKTKELYTSDIYFVMSDAKIPEIFVMKKYNRAGKNFHMEHKAFKKIQEMDDICKSVLISGKAVSNNSSHWILMEYFDGDLLDIERELTEKEKRNVLHTVVKAVKCLHDKGLYYTDMKLDQILYRVNEDNTLEIKLADLQVSEKGEKTIVTYKAPKKSSFVNVDGHFKYGSSDESVNWGIVILLIQLWSHENEKLQDVFNDYHRDHKKMIKALKGKIPDDIYYLIDELYDKWDKISSEDLFKALRI